MSYNNGPKPKLSRDEKKAKRRSAQNAKLEQKSRQEAAHFWQCAGRGGDAVPRLGAAELFASQSTGLKTKGDGLRLPPDNYQPEYTWGECPECKYFPAPVVPVGDGLTIARKR